MVQVSFAGTDIDMGGRSITGLADASTGTAPATKSQLDAAVAALTGGADWKASARVATAAALPANTYSNGTAGVGATLTATSNAALTVDGVSVAATDRVLVKNEVAGARNGIYTVTQVGSGSLPYILTRALDDDSAVEITSGMAVNVSEGTANADTTWTLTTNDPITVGTTALVFTQASGAGSYTAGTGLTLTGSSFAVTAPVSVALGGTNATTAAAARTSLDVPQKADVPYFNVKTYGAKLDVVRRTNGAITNGASILTSSGAAFTAADVGKLVQVVGADTGGNTLKTTIASYTNSTTVVLTDPAGTTVSGATVHYGTDDTTAFTNAIAAAVAAGGGVVFFPQGTAFTGQLTLYSRVHLVGSGMQTTVLMLKYAQHVDLIRSDQFASLAGLDVGGGVLQCGVRDLTLDGNSVAQHLPMATPAEPGVVASITGGTLAAGTYYYSVGRLSANGETLMSGFAGNSDVVASGTTGSVTITFPAAVFGQTGWVVRGRAWPYLKIASVGLVSTYVDTGTITPAGAKARSAFDASRGLAIFGYNYVIHGVTIRGFAGDGMYSEWPVTETMSDPLNDWMEAFVSDVKIHDCGGAGLAWNGPHDSVLTRVIVAFCSLSASNTLPGIHCIGNGYSSIFNHCHVFGNHGNAWHTEGNFMLNNCVGEGAALAQVYVEGDDVHIEGGSYFSAGVGSSTGIQIGYSGYQPPNCTVQGVRLAGFTTGTALDITNAGANLHVQARIKQASGVAVTGSIPADADLDIMVSGGTATPSVKQLRGRIMSTTTETPTAAAAASAGTSPPSPVLGANSTDTKGSVTFGTGSGSPGTAGYVTITFSAAFPRTPVVVPVATNQATAVKQPYVQAVSTTAVTFGLAVAGAASQANTVYGLAWQAIG